MSARTLVLTVIVLFAAMARLLPHPPNFTPIAALALFGAAHFKHRWAAFLAPMAAMLMSDAALEVVTRLGLVGGWLAGGRGFYEGMWVVYGTIALIAAVGLVLRTGKTILTVAAVTLGCSTLFFLVTNFAWWAGYDLYPHNVEGLLRSYIAALPFFHWTLLGDAFFATLLFGGFAMVERYYPVLRPAPAPGCS